MASRAFCSALLLVASTAPLVLFADEAAHSGLLACAKLGQNEERLNCYDRLAEKFDAAGGQVATQAAPAITSATPANMFGATRAPAAAKVERSELKFISARIVNLYEAPHRRSLIDLDNGQKWQQIGVEDMQLRVGQSISISRGLLGTFWLMTEGNRSCHVKRVL